MINQGFTFATAPMMDWTDRHCRVFHRMLSARALLYTEMVVADAVIHGDREYLIGYHETEHPLALQIGGADPNKLAQAAKIGADYGYDEINLNVGCPSDRVQAGRFGAALMAEPDLVAACFSAMAGAVNIPVSIKCRIGIDEQNPHTALPKFIQTLSAAGCHKIIIHARKAWLQGLSPKDNRTVPPLDYALVRQIKSSFPDINIILNGGLDDLRKARKQAQNLDGVMFGRAAYHNPWLLTKVDALFYGDNPAYITRDHIVDKLIQYAQKIENTDPSTKALPRHIMGLYHGQKGARIWRRALSTPHTSPSERIKTAQNIVQKAREKAA